MDRKTGWLKEALEEVRKDVESWPAWMRAQMQSSALSEEEQSVERRSEDHGQPKE